MSQLPKAPAASSIASKTTKSVVATLEHEALLRVVWRDLQTLVKARLAFLSDAAHKAVVPAQQQHTALAEGVIGSVRRRLGADDSDDKDHQALLDALPQLEAYLKRPLPEFDNGNFTVTIDRAALAVPFSEHEATRTARSAKPVGFIDIACSVTYPVEVAVRDGIPFELTGLDSGMWAIAKAGNFRRDLTFFDPQWQVTHETVPVWIDIRPELPPVGQLLRELRTLEHYAPANTIIWLFTATVDPEVEQMLLHEGYLVSTGEWATKTAQVSS